MLLTVLSSIAQHNVGFETFAGKVLRHKKGLLFDTPPLSSGGSFFVERNTDGSKAWHHYWGQPRFEGILLWMNFGNNEILGHAIGIAPGINFKLSEKGRRSLRLHYATGMAYITRPFHPIENVSNNAIGSHWNNLSRLKLSMDWKLKNELNFFTAFSFNHFSNGLSSSPNSGINTYGLNFGLRKSLDSSFEFQTERPTLVLNRRWGLTAMTGMGVSEHSNYGGPNFPIYFAGLGGYWRFKDFQKLHLGVEYEFSHKVYEFELAVFETEETAKLRASRTIIYIADELMFGDISMRFQVGFYTPYKSEHDGSASYIKVMTLYHLPVELGGEVRPFVGVMLKTHFAVAEYIGMAAGFSF